MSNNLFEAANQWMNRPNDQRFWGLDDLFTATLGHYESHAESGDVVTADLRATVTTRGGVGLTGREGKVAQLSHYGFGQLSQLAGSPAEFLRKLSPELATQCINERLAAQDFGNHRSSLLWHEGQDALTLRALLTPKYTRVWNCDVVERLGHLTAQGWKVPPALPRRNDPRARPATLADVNNVGAGSGVKIKPGDMIAPGGAYASDHDLFVFLIDDSRRIDDGSEGGLCRGVFITNSEVGDASLRIKTFLFRGVCGNHIVWSASKVNEVSIIHKGKDPFGKFLREAYTLAETSLLEGASATEMHIRTAKSRLLGSSTEEVVAALHKKHIAPKKTIEAALLEAARDCEFNDQRCNPFSVWGVVQGFTALSQLQPFGDRRMELDEAAGAVLALAG